jgi:capsular polysaccharide biosynthesis protein
MELMLIIRVLLRRWWLVLLPVVVAAVFVVPDFLRNRSAVSGGFTTVVRYTASQVLDNPDRKGDYQDIWLASELAVNALTDWVKTNSFAAEVAQKAADQGLKIDPDALAITSDNERSVGQVFITWNDEAQLKVIAQAAIGVLETRTQAYFPQLGDQPAQVRMLDAPQIAPAPPPIVDRFAPFIRIGLALLAGMGLAFLAEYLDPTLRRREEVEALGLTIVATIPKR